MKTNEPQNKDNNKETISDQAQPLTNGQSRVPENDSEPSDFVKLMEADRQRQDEELLRRETEEKNEFPIHVFPKNMQHIINEASKGVGYPKDYVAAAMLFAVTCAIGNTYRIESRVGSVYGANIFLAPIGDAGISKSPPLDFAVEPIREIDKKNSYNNKQAQKEYGEILREKKKDNDIELPDKPEFYPIIHTDFTSEALIKAHSHIPRGVCGIKDELKSLFVDRQGKGTSDNDEVLKELFTQSSISVSRIGRDSFLLPKPCVSIMGNLTIEGAHVLASGDKLVDGLLDRWLIVFLDNLKAPRWPKREMPKGIITLWDSIIKNIYAIPLRTDKFGDPDPVILRYSEEAYKLWVSWFDFNADRIDNQEYQELKSIYSKIAQYCSKFALILQILEHVCEGKPIDEIGIKATKGSIEMTEFFEKHAKKLRLMLTGIKPELSIPPHYRFFYDNLPETFLTSEAIEMGEVYVPSQLGNEFRITINVVKKKLLKDTRFVKRLPKQGHYEKV